MAKRKITIPRIWEPESKAINFTKKKPNVNTIQMPHPISIERDSTKSETCIL